MKSFIYFILIFLICSCNMGKQYANYRTGEKSNKKEIQMKDSAMSETKAEEEYRLEEIVCYDTLTIKNLPGNKTMMVLKEKTIKVNSCKVIDIKKRMKPILRKNKKFIAKKNHFHKSHSYYNKRSFNRNLWTTIIITSLVIGVIAFAISDSVVATVLIAILVALGMALIVALAFCLALFFIFWIIFAAFGLI